MEHGVYLRSGSTLFQARAAYSRSLESSPESEVCIALCVAAFEGFLNEIPLVVRPFDFSNDEKAVALSEALLEAEEARLSPVSKYRFAKFVLTDRFPRKGDQDVQRLTAIFKLRNSMLHLKPDPIFNLDPAIQESQSENKPPPEVALLIAEKVIERPIKFSGSWRTLVSTATVAGWTYENIVATMKSFTAVAPSPWVKQQLARLTEHLPDSPKNAA